MKLQWNQINWKTAEEQVNRLQIRIVLFGKLDDAFNVTLNATILC